MKLTALSFINGLIIIPLVINKLFGRKLYFGNDYTLVLFDPREEIVNMINIWGWILGGLLIGYGSSLARGDISYHYVSGVPKISINSIIFLLLSIVSAGLLALFKTFYP